MQAIYYLQSSQFLVGEIVNIYSMFLYLLQVLRLKLGAPVVLLKNVSPQLVNGLRGNVCDLKEAAVAVHFPSLSSTHTFEKENFPRFVFYHRQFSKCVSNDLSIVYSTINIKSKETPCGGNFIIHAKRLLQHVKNNLQQQKVKNDCFQNFNLILFNFRKKKR